MLLWLEWFSQIKGIGSGIILVCVTVSVFSGGVGAPATSLVFSASTKVQHSAEP